jgi:murein DD-endopeptidase MepM/ murein hydrolase activator NlpD
LPWAILFGNKAQTKRLVGRGSPEEGGGIAAVPGVKKLARVLPVLMILSLFPAVPAYSSDQSRLEQTRRDLRAARARLSSAVQDDAQILGVLNSITGKLRVEQSLLAVAQGKLNAINLRIASVQRRMAGLEAQRQKRAAVIAARARALYMMGPVDSLSALQSASSISDFYGRAGTLAYVAGYDRRVLEDLARIRNDMQTTQQELSIELKQAAAARNVIANQVSIVNEAAQVQQEAHNTLAARIAGYRSEVQSLQQDEAAIQRIISQRSSYAASYGPSGANGRLGFAWPTLSHRINSPYGPRWGGFHTGIDIWCPTGNPIFASKAGKVIFAGWEGGYGNTVVIDHGGGFSTLYAHQTRYYVHEGQIVAQHLRIGACGATGNATGAHLHFEVRVNGNPQNPMNYLP